MAHSHAPAPAGLSTGLTILFAVACGLCVANIYFAQPLIGPIAATLQLHAGLAGLIMTLTQLGYGTGLLLLVPLADVVENRRLIIFAMVGAVAGLVGIALSNSAGTFLAASFLVGTCAVAAQVLVPLASHLVPEARVARWWATSWRGCSRGSCWRGLSPASWRLPSDGAPCSRSPRC